MWPFTHKSSSPIEQKAGTLVAPDDELLAIFGITSSAVVPVSRADALSVPAVACAVRIISEAAATLDVKFKRIDNGVDVEDNSHPAAHLLRQRANPWTSGFELIRDLVAQALTSNGGGLAWINRVDGKPTEIIRYDTGIIVVEYANDGTGEPGYSLNGFPLKSSDVIHVRGLFDKCPLSMAADGIGLARIMEQHAARLFKSGARPGGVIEVPKGLGDEALKKMRKAWSAAHEGVDNAGRTAILFDGASFKQMALKSTDAQFEELRTFQLREIARAFSIPQHMIGVLDRATWSNTESLGREFLSYCLEPWLRALEAGLSRALFTSEEAKTWRIEFDRDDLTRADLATRATAINSLIASRVINPNEGRAWLDMPPREGGEEFANPNTGSSQPGNGGGSNAA